MRIGGEGRKYVSHFPLLCASTIPVFWMTRVWLKRTVAVIRREEISLTRTLNRSAPQIPCCSERSLSRMYTHLGLFTSIPPAGWQARLTAGGVTLLSGNHRDQRVLQSVQHFAKGDTESAAPLMQKITEETSTSFYKLLPVSVHNLDLNY